MVAIVLCVAGERLYDGVVNIDDDNEDDVDDGVDDSDDVGEMLTEKEKKMKKPITVTSIFFSLYTNIG